MKIVICGAQSVGKTTLIDSLPEKYKSLVVKKLIRETILKSDENIRYNEKSDIYSQSKFFDIYYNVLSKLDNYISDRGLIDVCAYSKNLAEDRQLGTGLYLHQLRLLKEWQEKYPDTIYVYIPIEFDIVDDGFRSLDEYYRKGCDSCIREVLEEINANYIVIKGSHEERVKKFKKLISDIENGKKIKFDHVQPIKIKRKKLPIPDFSEYNIINKETQQKITDNTKEIIGKVFKLPMIK